MMGDIHEAIQHGVPEPRKGSDECRFDAENYCTNHRQLGSIGYPRAALCAHAAVALQARVKELTAKTLQQADLYWRTQHAYDAASKEVDHQTELRLALEARVRELEAMWLAKSEVGDARIARAEQMMRRLHGYVEGFVAEALARGEKDRPFILSALAALTEAEGI